MWFDEGPPEWFTLKRHDIRRSLSGDLQVTREDLLSQSNLCGMYQRLYTKYFGAKEFGLKGAWKSREELTAKLHQTRGLCQKGGYDIATWIAAQMWAYRFARRKNCRMPVQFPISWLAGPRSGIRTRHFIREGRKHVNAPVEESGDWKTLLGRLQTDLALAEEEVAAEYLARYLWDGSLDWSGAISEVRSCGLWMCLEFQGTCTGEPKTDKAREFKLVKVMQQVGGVDQLKQEWHYARLKAAWAIAQKMQSGLPDHIGFDGSWSWEGFVRLMGRLFPKRVCHDEEPDLSDVIGTVWGTHRRGRQKGTGTRGEKRKAGRRDILR